MANKAIEKMVIDYLHLLTEDEIKNLIKIAKGTNFEISFPPKYYGDKRVINLPNIDAASEFDEMMESFRKVHASTEMVNAK